MCTGPVRVIADATRAMLANLILWSSNGRRDRQGEHNLPTSPARAGIEGRAANPLVSGAMR